MKLPNEGDHIFLPVEVSSGAFAGECLITFNTIEGPVSGFISSDQIHDFDGTKAISAKVLQVDSDRIAIRLHGSFFTTTGLAHISAHAPFERAA